MGVFEDLMNASDAVQDDNLRFVMTAAAIGSTDMPVAAIDHPWDREAADARVRAWAGAQKGPNSRYARAFLYKNPEETGYGAYKGLMVDIIDGKPTVVPAAIEEVASGLGEFGLGENDLPAVRGRIETLYKKLGGQAPWEVEANAEPAAQAASASEPVTIELPDGTTLHFATAQAVETNPDGTVHVRTAALPTADAVSTNGPGATPPQDGSSGGNEAARVEALENRMNAVEEAVGEIMQFIQSQVEAQTASASAAIDAAERDRAQRAAAALDREVELPNPHIMVNGQCVWCTSAYRAASGDKKPYGDVEYADPGYQDDKKKRYPLDTEEHVRAALGYINQGDNAAKYNADDLAKVKAKIQSAAKKLGIDTGAKSAAGNDMVDCPTCDGSGSVDGEDCPTCKGSGKIPKAMADKLKTADQAA